MGVDFAAVRDYEFSTWWLKRTGQALLTRRLHERVAERDNLVVLVEGDVGDRISDGDAIL